MSIENKTRTFSQCIGCSVDCLAWGSLEAGGEGAEARRGGCRLESPGNLLLPLEGARSLSRKMLPRRPGDLDGDGPRGHVHGVERV